MTNVNIILSQLKTNFVVSGLKKGLSLKQIGDVFNVDKKQIQRIGIRNGQYSVRSPKFAR